MKRILIASLLMLLVGTSWPAPFKKKRQFTDAAPSGTERFSLFADSAVLPSPPFASLMRSMKANTDRIGIVLIGDSTGNEDAEWFYKFIKWLLTIYPNYVVEYHLWNSTADDYSTTVRTVRGATATEASPVLIVYNGSRPGATIGILSNMTRLKKLIPATVNYQSIILSCSLNDGAETGSTYISKWRVWIKNIRSITTKGQLTITSQNPKVAPAAYINEHAIRREQIMYFADTAKHFKTDAYQRFYDVSKPWYTLIKSDGIHPTTSTYKPTGSEVWADEIITQAKRSIATSDVTPPVVTIQFNGISNSANTYNNRVEVVINAADDGGSGLASTEYSLNRAAFQPYTSSIIVNTPGDYTITTRATDGNSNTTTTDETAFTVISAPEPLMDTLTVSADAFTRDGSYAGINYGSDTNLLVKGSTASGYTRLSYFKFSLNNVSSVASAKLRIFGSNKDNTLTTNISCFGVNTDSWTESGITWNNSPAPSTTALSSIAVNNRVKYYELDVTSYVKTESLGDKVVSLLIKDVTNQNRNLAFNSRENKQSKPELVITTSNTAQKPALSYGMTGRNTVNKIERTTVYPNPIGKTFTIKIPTTLPKNLSLQISDQVGRIYNIDKTAIQSAGPTVNVDISKLSLKPGVYFLKIISTMANQEIKLVVQ